MSTETAEITIADYASAPSDQQHLAFIQAVQRLLACHQAMQERFPAMDLPFTQAAIRAAQAQGMISGEQQAALLELAGLSQDVEGWLEMADAARFLALVGEGLGDWKAILISADL